MRAYVVQRGEDLGSIASRLGFVPAEVWAADENRELRARRPDPGVLAPGDVLFVPQGTPARRALTVGSTNRLVARVPMVRLRLVVRAGGATLLPNEPFRVEGLVTPIEGVTDGDALLDVRLPAHIREVRLVIPRLRTTTALDIGTTDPVELPTGLRQRLAHLGYLVPTELLPPPHRREVGPRELERALRRFQRARGLPETGSADEGTRAALLEAHGS